MHLKGNWKLEDMDPEGSIHRDLMQRERMLLDKL
jgi:hypothetical protein